MDKDKNKIIFIDADPLLNEKKRNFKKLRVAAYCRVSTDNNEQLKSYKSQISYYKNTIAKNPNWTFVKVYADEGISGTLTKNRDGFNSLIRDCEKGRIDLILTKSISRFARNTLDTLKYVRKLKEKGIGIYFEEECLDTLKMENEMTLGLLAVMAQSESENISANIKWGIRQRMKSGTFKFKYNILGYEKGEDGNPKIVESEAVYIRKIYDMFLEGKSKDQIKDYLEQNGILSKKGKKIWTKTAIKNILENERYCGDMLMQKTYTEDCISKKVKVNRGELPKYLITDNHPAIVSRETFKAVQKEIERRAVKSNNSGKNIVHNCKYSGKYALTELLICEKCGSNYRRKTWKKSDGTYEGVWICLNRVKNGVSSCNSPCLNEAQLHEAICKCLLKVYDNLGGEKDSIIASITNTISKSENDLKVFNIENQIKDLNVQLNDMVSLMQKTKGDKNKFYIAIKKISDDIIDLKKKLEIYKNQLNNTEEESAEKEKIIKLFNDKGNFINYNDNVIRTVVDKIIVGENKKIIITVKGGYKIEEQV